MDLSAENSWTVWKTLMINVLSEHSLVWNCDQLINSMSYPNYLWLLTIDQDLHNDLEDVVANIRNDRKYTKDVFLKILYYKDGLFYGEIDGSNPYYEFKWNEEQMRKFVEATSEREIKMSVVSDNLS